VNLKIKNKPTTREREKRRGRFKPATWELAKRKKKKRKGQNERDLSEGSLSVAGGLGGVRAKSKKECQEKKSSRLGRKRKRSRGY